jgi:hypothetical protein
MSEAPKKPENEPEVAAPAPGTSAAKWAAVVDDVVVPMPSRLVSVHLIKSLANVPADFVLVRDHNSPNDVVLKDDAQADLAKGNVFYRLARCEVQERSACRDVPKRAFVVNDRAEITIRSELSGEVLRELFGLQPHAHLLRDTEGPNDQPVEPATVVRFEDGPVFISRAVHAALSITVNSRVFTEHEGVKEQMPVLEIARLAYPENPSETRVWFVSDGNRELSLGDTIHVHCGDVFDVVRKEVTGGYELSRVEREIELVRGGGLQVTLLKAPVDAIIYHELRTRPGTEPALSDVLVPIPSGYPGSMLDSAYLPDDSPLIGRVKGQPEGGRIAALGKNWRQISYHPHKGGGAPKWDPTVHGFHTYLGELVSWLHNLR